MTKLLLQLILFILLPTIGFSQSTFEGGTSSSWTEPDNWNPVGVPADGTEIIIETTGGNNPIIPTGTYSYSGITIKDGYELTIEAGAVVTVTGTKIWNLGKLFVRGQLLGTGANTLLKNGSAFSSTVDEVYFHNGSTLNISGKIWNINGTMTTDNSTISTLGIDNGGTKHSNISFSKTTQVTCTGDINNIYGTISITKSEITANSLTNNANDATYHQIINLTESSATFTGFIAATNDVVINEGDFNIYDASSVTLDVPNKVGYIYFKNKSTGTINIKPSSNFTFTNRTLGNFGTLNIQGNLSGIFRLINGSEWVTLGTTTISSSSTVSITGNIVNTYGSISINGGKLIGDFIFLTVKGTHMQFIEECLI